MYVPPGGLNVGAETVVWAETEKMPGAKAIRDERTIVRVRKRAILFRFGVFI